MSVRTTNAHRVLGNIVAAYASGMVIVEAGPRLLRTYVVSTLTTQWLDESSSRARALVYIMKANMQLKGQIHDTLAASYDIDATVYDIDHDVDDAMDC